MRLAASVPRPQKGDTSDFTITTDLPDLQTLDTENERSLYTEQAVDVNAPFVTEDNRITSKNQFK